MAATPAAPLRPVPPMPVPQKRLCVSSATADELLSALADMRDDCSLLDEDIPASQSTPMQALPKPDALQYMPVPAMSGSMEPGAAVPHLSSLPPTDYPSNVDEAMAMYHYQQQQQQQVYQNEQQQQQQPASMVHTHHSLQVAHGISRIFHFILSGLVIQPRPLRGNQTTTLSLELPQLLRTGWQQLPQPPLSRERPSGETQAEGTAIAAERSELACDLEGLQETLSHGARRCANARAGASITF